jgi:hypothetical protein
MAADLFPLHHRSEVLLAVDAARLFAQFVVFIDDRLPAKGMSQMHDAWPAMRARPSVPWKRAERTRLCQPSTHPDACVPRYGC